MATVDDDVYNADDNSGGGGTPTGTPKEFAMFDPTGKLISIPVIKYDINEGLEFTTSGNPKFTFEATSGNTELLLKGQQSFIKSFEGSITSSITFNPSGMVLSSHGSTNGVSCNQEPQHDSSITNKKYVDESLLFKMHAGTGGALDYTNGDYQTYTSGINITLANPTNMIAGQTATYEITTSGGAKILRGVKELHDGSIDGIFLVTVVCTGTSTFRYTYATEVVA